MRRPLWLLIGIPAAIGVAVGVAYAVAEFNPVGYATSQGITVGETTGTDPQIQKDTLRFLDIWSFIEFQHDGVLSANGPLRFNTDMSSINVTATSNEGALVLGASGMTQGAWLVGVSAPATIGVAGTDSKIVSSIAVQPEGNVVITLGQ